MEDTLNFQILSNLPSEVIKMAKNNEFLTLLNEPLISKYYDANLRKELKALFTRFNDIKFFYKVNDSYSLKANQIKIDKVNGSSLHPNQILNMVGRKIDEEQFVEVMYYRILNLSIKLTYQEALYFIKYFFSDTTEEEISEILAISRTNLQKIKKSCLVKVYLEVSDLI